MSNQDLQILDDLIFLSQGYHNGKCANNGKPCISKSGVNVLGDNVQRFVDGYHGDWHTWRNILAEQSGCILDWITCRLCFEKYDDLHEHHISYFPEITESICNSCHSSLNREMFIGSWIQYSNEDYHKFYQNTLGV